MSFRVTRSSARRSAGSAIENPPPSPALPPARPSPVSSRKRKTTARDPSPEQADTIGTASTHASRAKRAKVEPQDSPAQAQSRPKGAKGKAAMSSTGSVPEDPLEERVLTLNSPPADANEEKPGSSSSAKRSKGTRKNGAQADSSRRQPRTPQAEHDPDTPSTSRRSSRRSNKVVEQDVSMEDAPQEKRDEETRQSGEEHTSDEEDGDGQGDHYDEDEEDEDEEDDDPFTSGFLGRHPGSLSALRQLTGMMAGTTTRLRGILEQLRSPDTTMQLVALQELSEVLLISTEDNLAGHFAPDAYVKELVKLMQPNEFTGEENPEIMLLACRCLANLMEALPQATANVVYGGAVPVLCSKLLEINFIDLAEQCLSTLEKISVSTLR